MAIHREETGETVLRGPLPDEPALHGVLARIRDLGLALIAVQRSGSRDASGAPRRLS
jgi:hypothetical protein